MTPAEKLQAELEVADTKTVMGTPAGRRWVWALLDASGVWADTFQESPTLHARAAGRRSMGLDVMARLQRTVPFEYLAMVREAAQTAADEQARVDLEAAKTDS